MPTSGAPTWTEAAKALAQAIAVVPLTELPALIGLAEEIKAAGWTRLHAGPQNRHTADELLTVREVAQRLKLSPYRTYELCRQGAMKSVKLGKSVRVKESDLAAYLASQGS